MLTPMTRHRFTFDVTFRHIVDVEVERGTRRVRSRAAAIAYLTNQLSLMDWEDLLCHTREAVPVELGPEDLDSLPAGADHPTPHAVIVVGENGASPRGFEFHPDDPVGRYDGFIRLGPPASEGDLRTH
jgi:hypothetical protein